MANWSTNVNITDLYVIADEIYSAALLGTTCHNLKGARSCWGSWRNHQGEAKRSGNGAADLWLGNEE